MKIGIGLVMISGLLTAVFASEAPDPALSQVREVLQARFPDAKILSVSPSPISGLYEVVAADSIYYADGSGDHLIHGEMLETKTDRNLTASRWEELHKIDFAKLPLALAIKRVHGTGRRAMAIFEDPQCPYCKQMEKTLADIPDVTIYTFLLPLEDVHPGSRLKAQALWCAADRSDAWSRWILNEQVTESKPCADPADEVTSLATTLDVQATPTMFLGDGQRLVGVVSKERLLKGLEIAATSIPRPAADLRAARSSP